MMTFDFPHYPLSEEPDLPVHWVADETALYRLIEEIDDSQMVALDTEFIRRNTYQPILALIQVNTGRGIYLVDAPKLKLTDFWQALMELPLMLWYACGEDLSIFYSLTDCPPLTNVMDVQIALSYLVDNYQIGYSQAVSRVLGVELDKGESQSDWLARPLSTEQKHYAVNDVKYLPALYQACQDALIQKNQWAYATEDCRHYVKELHTTHHMPADELYVDNIMPIYNKRQITALKELVTWREKLAKSTNQPRNFIIGKQPLREIIETLPTTLKLLANTTINRRALRLYGDAIITIIKKVQALPESELISSPKPFYSSKNRPFKKALNQAISEHSQALQLPEQIFMRSRWVNDLLYLTYKNSDDLSAYDYLSGYRRDWVVSVALPLLKEYQTDICEAFDRRGD